MRHRILDALKKADDALPDGAEPHVELLHRHARAALDRSRERGWGLEHNPARLHVQTIDGLNHWLARRLPRSPRASACRRRWWTTRAACMRRPRAGRSRCWTRNRRSRPSSTGSRGHSITSRSVLALLIEGMLGARELWMPKLLDSSDRESLRAEIDGLLQRALEAELRAVTATLSAIDWLPLFAICRAAVAAGAPESPDPHARAASEPAGAERRSRAALAGACRIAADRQGRDPQAGDCAAGFPARSGRRRLGAAQARHEGAAGFLG